MINDLKKYTVTFEPINDLEEMYNTRSDKCGNEYCYSCNNRQFDSFEEFKQYYDGYKEKFIESLESINGILTLAEKILLYAVKNHKLIKNNIDSSYWEYDSELIRKPESELIHKPEIEQ